MRLYGAPRTDPAGVMPVRPVLEARGLTRRFGREVALAPLDFVLHEGEIVGLAGPNGAGKSTLLSLLAGALAPTGGTIRRHGNPRIGWAPQQPAHYGRLTARENLELFARLRGARDGATAAAAALGAFGLPADGGPSASLSLGNRQRLSLAIGFLGEPTVLLLDEPTASLDPPQRDRLWARVAGLREEGAAVVFATQHVEEVEAWADRALVLRAGEVIWAGDSADAAAVLA